MGSTYVPHTEDSEGLGRAWQMDTEISPATVGDGTLLLALDWYTHPQLGTIRDAKGAGGGQQGGGGSGETPPPIELEPEIYAFGYTDPGDDIEPDIFAATTLGATTYKLAGTGEPLGMRIVTDVAAGSYEGIADVWSVFKVQSGILTGDVERTNKHENRLYIGAYVEDDPQNGNMRDGWYINVLAVADSVKLTRIQGGAETDIGDPATIVFPSGASTLNWAFQPGVGAWAWLSGPRPNDPTFPATGTDFPASAEGHVGFHINSGGGGESFEFVCSPILFDPLDGPVSAGPPADAPISGDLTKPYTPSGVKNLSWAVDFEDTFSGSELDSAKWLTAEPFYSAPGYGGDVWHPLPVTSDVLGIGTGVLRLTAQLLPNLPGGAKYAGVEVLSRGKYATPQLTAGKKYFIEARTKCDSSNGFWPALWTEGFNDLHVQGDDHTGWPTLGENDIYEFFNLKGGIGYPYWSVHYPSDLDTDPPGTFLADEHQYQRTQARRMDLLDSWHTWGLLVEDTSMSLYVDGQLLFQYEVGETYAGHEYTQAIHDLFRSPQFLRLTASADGYAATGWDDSELESGTMLVDYVRVFKV